MNRLSPCSNIQRLHGNHLRGPMMMKNTLRRKSNQCYVSCLTGFSTAPNTKRSACAKPRVSPSSPRRHYHQIIASWETPSALYNRANFIKCDNPSPRQLFHQHNYPSRSQRFFSAIASSTTKSSIDNTPLDGPEGAALLEGLDMHTIHSDDDGHPLAVYTVGENDTDGSEQQKHRTPVLLLHGRTWSSVTVYHLTGGGHGNEASAGGENRSLLKALYDTHHIQPYAMDFRGFGGTPKDKSGLVEPLRCVSDVVSVLNWMHDKHNKEGSEDYRPALLGWSHGALIAQITAQRHEEALSKLILYGSIYNPNVKYSLPSPSGFDDPHKGHTDHDDFPLHEMAARNEYDGAMEDFTNFINASNETRTFPPVSAKLFAEAALVSDPVKVQWSNLHQLNECHPSLVKVPTMVIAGDQDPYAPMLTQAELFTNLARGVDRVWSIIANADHAVHLSDERHRFVEDVNNFLETRL